MNSSFWLYLTGASLIAAGYADFPLIAYHFQKTAILSPVWVPISYAIAMGINTLTAPLFGHFYEEKETDVNIAIYMVRDAILKKFDKLILITNDTDINPAIEMAKKENPAIEIRLLTPPTYKTHDSLRKIIIPGKATVISERQIQLSLLPASITKPNGKIIHRPKEYTP